MTQAEIIRDADKQNATHATCRITLTHSSTQSFRQKGTDFQKLQRMNLSFI